MCNNDVIINNWNYFSDYLNSCRMALCVAYIGNCYFNYLVFRKIKYTLYNINYSRRSMMQCFYNFCSNLGLIYCILHRLMHNFKLKYVPFVTVSSQLFYFFRVFIPFPLFMQVLCKHDLLWPFIPAFSSRAFFQFLYPIL